MFALPSVSSTPSVVPRPLLVSDGGARTTNVRAIEPTTAVSKERSKVDVRVPEGLTRTQSPSASSSTAVSYTPAQVKQAGAARAAAVSTTAQQPSAERSGVQKAVDTQVKELISTVWKASAKAVDFLLGRPEPTAAQVAAASEPMNAILWSLTAPAGSRFSQAVLTSAIPEVSTPSTDGGQPIVYSSRGASTGQTSSAGSLLNVLA